MPEIIKVTSAKGAKVEIKEFDNTPKGQKEATAYCKELHKEHLSHPYFELMTLAKGKSDLQRFLRDHTYVIPESLHVQIETLLKDENNFDDLL